MNCWWEGGSPKSHCLRQTAVKIRERAWKDSDQHICTLAFPAFSSSRPCCLASLSLSHLLPRGPPFISGPSWQFYLTVSKPPSGFLEKSALNPVSGYLKWVGAGCAPPGTDQGPTVPSLPTQSWDTKVFYSLNTPSTLGRTGREASPTLASVLPPPQPSRPSPSVTFEHTHIHTAHACPDAYIHESDSARHHPPEHFTPRSHHPSDLSLTLPKPRLIPLSSP